LLCLLCSVDKAFRHFLFNSQRRNVGVLKCLFFNFAVASVGWIVLFVISTLTVARQVLIIWDLSVAWWSLNHFTWERTSRYLDVDSPVWLEIGDYCSDFDFATLVNVRNYFFFDSIKFSIFVFFCNYRKQSIQKVNVWNSAMRQSKPAENCTHIAFPKRWISNVLVEKLFDLLFSQPACSAFVNYSECLQQVATSFGLTT